MMEETDPAKKTRKILSFRQLELTHPDFNTRLMQAITQEKFARQQRQFFIFWMMVVGTLEFVVVLLLWLYRVTLSDIAHLPSFIVNQVGEVCRWLIAQHYLFFPVAVVLLLKAILDSRTKYS